MVDTTNRYKLDKNFRDKIKLAAKKKWLAGEHSRIKKREATLKKRASEATKNLSSGHTRKINPKKVKIDSTIVLVYPSIHLSSRLGISPQILRKYLSAKVLPDPTFTDSIGRRWFSEDYITSISTVFIPLRSKIWSLEKLKNELMTALPNAKWS